MVKARHVRIPDSEKNRLTPALTTKPNFYIQTKPSTEELLMRYNEIWEELKKRKVIRSGNNLVADYGEKIAADKLGLLLEKQSTKGYDATDAAGKKYQIKARKWGGRHPSKQLGVIRDLTTLPFDFLVVVIFNPDLSLEGIWKLPIEAVSRYAHFSVHQNGHILNFTKEVIEDLDTKKVF